MAAPKEPTDDRQAPPGGGADTGERKASPSGTHRNAVDEASKGSFPASDPPSFNPTHIGAPDESEED